MNRYTYVHNNPLKYQDPSGHFIATITGGIIGGAVSGITAAMKGTNIKSGIVSGAVSGVIVGAAVDLTAASGGLATIGFIAVAGALGTTAGDYVDQVGNSLANGESLSEAVRTVDMGSLITSAVIGGGAGAVSGATAQLLKVLTTATRESIKEIVAASANSLDNIVVTKTVSGAYEAISSAARTVAIIDYTANIIYNSLQNAFTYYINNEKVAEIDASSFTY